MAAPHSSSVLRLTRGVNPSLSTERASTSRDSLRPGFSATQWRREQVSLVRPREELRWRRVVSGWETLVWPLDQSSQVSF